jgi:hypothetical protein
VAKWAPPPRGDDEAISLENVGGRADGWPIHALIFPGEHRQDLFRAQVRSPAPDLEDELHHHLWSGGRTVKSSMGPFRQARRSIGVVPLDPFIGGFPADAVSPTEFGQREKIPYVVRDKEGFLVHGRSLLPGHGTPPRCPHFDGMCYPSPRNKLSPITPDHTLGASADSPIAEIGGGYGCLSFLMYRAGLRNYAIYDLPWVNAIQGYFLIMSLSKGVRLYGEPASNGTLEILPYWMFEEVRENSIDFVVNTDSLPEMGASTAEGYIRHIPGILSNNGIFFSVNQEAMSDVHGAGAQNCVRDLIVRNNHYRVASRHRYWMRQGYVEEVFVPIMSPSKGITPPDSM